MVFGGFFTLHPALGVYVSGSMFVDAKLAKVLSKINDKKLDQEYSDFHGVLLIEAHGLFVLTRS